MDDSEKIRNFDKLTFEEICELTGQHSEEFLNDAIPPKVKRVIFRLTHGFRMVCLLLRIHLR